MSSGFDLPIIFGVWEMFDQDVKEQRKHRRFKVVDGIVALFSLVDLCIPIDISAGGLAIKSCGYNTHHLPGQWAVDILLNGERFHANIPVKLAWKRKSNNSYFPYLFGFQFANLTETNQAKVEHLIKLHEDFELNSKRILLSMPGG